MGIAGAPMAVISDGQGSFRGLLSAHHMLDPMHWVAGVCACAVLAGLQQLLVTPVLAKECVQKLVL
eukprot:1159985-Pelagomonas_calceolata.AAC.4